MPRKGKKVTQCRANLDEFQGWIFINETRFSGMDGYCWAFSNIKARPYHSVMMDAAWETVEEAIEDARAYGVEFVGKWIDHKPALHSAGLSA